MSKKTDEELMKMDLYKLLGVAEDATTKEITKAYKAKARECHPDKNPDDPEKAKELFLLIQSATDVLKDIGQRAEYDHKRKAKKAAKAKVEQYDAKRRKMMEDLEAREKRYEEELKEAEKKKAKKDLEEQMREENRRELAEAIEQQNQQARRKAEAPAVMKIKWNKPTPNQSEKHRYTKEKIERIFYKHGDITVVFNEKKRVALVEFVDPKAAVLAKSIESGFPENPFKSIDWYGTPPLVAYQRNDYNESSFSSTYSETREREVMEMLKRAAAQQKMQKSSSNS